MRDKYTSVVTTTRIWHKLALAGLLAAGTTAAQAQALNYSVGNAQNVAGTYTDLGTTGTVIATANTDDANSAEQLIGFTFAYNGASMDRFILNTNGFLKLGAAAGMTAPTVALYTTTAQSNSGGTLLGTAAADVNLISPFNFDLLGGTGTPEYRMATTGTSPNRVCTIQWKDVADKAIASTAGGAVTPNQYANMSFQVKLYESTNIVEFVFAAPTVASAANDNFKYAQCGIKGSGNAANQIIKFTKGSVTAWSAATIAAGPITAGATGALNFRQAVAPDNGRTFRFAPQVANDAAVQAIYTLGKLPVPIATPHVIKAVIRNTGTSALTNVSVTATIAGANAFSSVKTIASLAVGASDTATFDPYTPTTAATQTVTVTLANDGNTANNVKTYQQQVNTTTFAYAEPGVAAASSIGFNTGSGILATRYTSNTARVVTAANVYLADVNSVGKTVYGVVTDANGTILAASPNYVVLAADIAAYHTFTFTSPVAITAGNFYIGLAQTAGATGYFPVGNQVEDPSRSNAVFSIPLAGGTPSDQAVNNLGRLMIEAVTGDLPANDAAVQIIYTLGKTPVNTAQTVQAIVRNAGSTALTNLAVVLNVAGANTFANAVTVPSLAVGASTTVTFPAFTPVATGNNTITVTVPADAIAANNTQTSTQTVTASTFSYTNTATPASSVGFQPATTGAFVAKFTTPNARTIGGVGAVLADPDATGRTVYGVMVSATGALVARSADYVIQAADINQLKSFTFSTPVPVAAGNFYIGLVQTTDPTGNGYFPMGTVAESPTRSATFYTVAPFTALGGTLVDAATSNLGIFMLEAQNATVQGTSAALNRAVSMYPNPSSGVVKLDVRGANAKGNLNVQVINLLGQTVYSSSLKDNFTNEVNLSSLANGIYTLKVQTGSEFTSRQLVLTK